MEPQAARLPRRILTALGLAYAPGGEPRKTTGRSSRYQRGFGISSRLDEDVDGLREQVAELQRQLNDRA